MQLKYRLKYLLSQFSTNINSVLTKSKKKKITLVFRESQKCKYSRQCQAGWAAICPRAAADSGASPEPTPALLGLWGTEGRCSALFHCLCQLLAPDGARGLHGLCVLFPHPRFLPGYICSLHKGALFAPPSAGLAAALDLSFANIQAVCLQPAPPGLGPWQG